MPKYHHLQVNAEFHPNRDLIETSLGTRRSEISYTCPGNKDTVYCGKDEHGEKVDKEKHYLLWTFKEILPMLNKELEKELGECVAGIWFLSNPNDKLRTHQALLANSPFLLLMP